MNQEHPDTPLLEHAQELVSKLDGMGIKPSPEDEQNEEDEEEDEWEDMGSEDGDIEMS